MFEGVAVPVGSEHALSGEQDGGAIADASDEEVGLAILASRHLEDDGPISAGKVVDLFGWNRLGAVVADTVAVGARFIALPELSHGQTVTPRDNGKLAIRDTP